MRRSVGFGLTSIPTTYRGRNALPRIAPQAMAEFVHQCYVTFHHPVTHSLWFLLITNALQFLWLWAILTRKKGLMLLGSLAEDKL